MGVSPQNPFSSSSLHLSSLLANSFIHNLRLAIPAAGGQHLLAEKDQRINTGGRLEM